MWLQKRKEPNVCTHTHTCNHTTHSAHVEQDFSDLGIILRCELSTHCFCRELNVIFMESGRTVRRDCPGLEMHLEREQASATNTVSGVSAGVREPQTHLCSSLTLPLPWLDGAATLPTSPDHCLLRSPRRVTPCRSPIGQTVSAGWSGPTLLFN